MFRTIASFVWQKDNTKKSVKSSIFVSFCFAPAGLLPLWVKRCETKEFSFIQKILSLLPKPFPRPPGPVREGRRALRGACFGLLPFPGHIYPGRETRCNPDG